MDWFAEPFATRQWPTWLRYALTGVMVAAAAAFSATIWPRLEGYPFLLFFVAIVVPALFFDRGSGFLALGLSALATAYFQLEPFEDIRIAHSRDLLAWVVFIGVGAFVTTIIEAMHMAVHKLHDANRLLVASEREKRLLLNESAHRIRNDLTVLTSLVRLQGRRITDEAGRDALASTAERIEVLSQVQQQLTQGTGGPVVDTCEFVNNLCDGLRSSLLELKPISLHVEAERHQLEQSRAVAVGLIINELLTNAVKYAFPDDRTGAILVRFARREGEFELLVRDNGVGTTNAAELGGSGLGQRLIRAMAAQLGGELQIVSTEATPGVCAIVRFPVQTLPQSD